MGKEGEKIGILAVTEQGFQYPVVQANGANILGRIWEFSNALAIADRMIRRKHLIPRLIAN